MAKLWPLTKIGQGKAKGTRDGQGIYNNGQGQNGQGEEQEQEMAKMKSMG